MRETNPLSDSRISGTLIYFLKINIYLNILRNINY